MSSVQQSLSSFQPTGSSAAAAAALEAHLRSAGHRVQALPQARAQMGVELLHVAGADDVADAVLVSMGSVDTVRTEVETLLRLGGFAFRPHLCTNVVLPPDVAAIFDDGPIARLQQALKNAPEAALSRPTSELSQMVDWLLPVLREHTGRDLDLDAPSIFQHIDEMVMSTRPEGTHPHETLPESRVWPRHLLLALGMINTEAVLRRLRAHDPAIKVEFGQPERGDWQPVRTFDDAGGQPAVRIDGLHMFNLSAKVIKLWFNGEEDSVRALWSLVQRQCRLGEPPTPADDPALLARLDTVLALANTVLAETLDDLRQTGTLKPILTDGSTSMELPTDEGPRLALKKSTVLIDTILARADAAVAVLPVTMRLDHGDAAALLVRAYLPKTPTYLTLALPLDAVGTHAVSIQGSQAWPEAYDAPRIASHGLAGLELELTTTPRPLRPTASPTAATTATPTDAPTPNPGTTKVSSDLRERLRLWRTASYGPIAALLTLQPDATAQDAVAFAHQLLGAHSLFLATVTATNEEEIHQRFQDIQVRPGLREASLAALGVVFSETPGGTEARQAFMGVLDARPAETPPMLLSGGRDAALTSTVVLPMVNLPADEELLATARTGLFATFLTVAISDGSLDPEEWRMFPVLGANRLLYALLEPMELDPQVQLENMKGLDPNALWSALARVLADHPTGKAAGTHLTAGLLLVASADGEVSDAERASIMEHVQTLGLGTLSGARRSSLLARAIFWSVIALALVGGISLLRAIIGMF